MLYARTHGIVGLDFERLSLIVSSIHEKVENKRQEDEENARKSQKARGRVSGFPGRVRSPRR